MMGNDLTYIWSVFSIRPHVSWRWNKPLFPKMLWPRLL